MRPTVNLVKAIIQLLKIEPQFENAGVALDVFHRWPKVAINSAIRQNYIGGEMLLESIVEATKIENELLTANLMELKDITLATVLIKNVQGHFFEGKKWNREDRPR